MASEQPTPVAIPAGVPESSVYASYGYADVRDERARQDAKWGVSRNLLALFDDLDRAALDRAALAPHDAADLLRKLAAMAPNRPLGARGAGATATDTSGPNTGALGA